MKFLLSFVVVFFMGWLNAQDVKTVILKTKNKLNSVTDYYAKAEMTTNIPFLRLPSSNIELFYIKPDSLRVKPEKGVAFTPKGVMNMNLNKLIYNDDVDIIDLGLKNGLRVIKLIPKNEDSEIVMSTLHIDETNYVIKKAKAINNLNKSVELEMTYSNFIKYGLPSSIKIIFNVEDYKLPKGITFDFETGKNAKPKNTTKNQKGQADIKFLYYSVNFGEGKRL